MHLQYRLFRDVLIKLRRDGFWRTMRFAVSIGVRPFSSAHRRFVKEDRAFDLKYGTNTTGEVSTGFLDIPNELRHHVNKYQGITDKTFNLLLSYVSIDFSEFTFIDVGSGKGRALLLASSFPFRRIIGVELSSALTEVSRVNVKTYRDPLQKCWDIECVCSDATDFPLPLENTFFYLFNPFDGSIMQKFVKRLDDSLREHPRNVFLVYHVARHPEALDNCAGLEKIKDGKIFLIYGTPNRARL